MVAGLIHTPGFFNPGSELIEINILIVLNQKHFYSFAYFFFLFNTPVSFNPRIYVYMHTHTHSHTYTYKIFIFKQSLLFIGVK